MVSCSITACVVSSLSELGPGCVECVSQSVYGVSLLMRGGMKCGQCLDLRENGENPVDAFMVFIMLK